LGGDPGCGVRHIFDLFRPRDLWQQSIVNDGNADPVRGEESSDVAIDIGASDGQVLIAAVPTASVHKNEDRPTGAHRNEEIETLFWRISLAIGLVANDLALWKVCLFVQKLNSGPLDCRTSRKKDDTEAHTANG
jgi:hypothetical protein